MNNYPHLAHRLERIAPFHVMALLERAQALEAAGQDVIHLEVGEPDFPAPGEVTEAARLALEQGYTHYTPATGMLPLRQQLQAFYRSRFGVDVPMERILVTPGASGALQLALAALVNPGDGVLVTDPGYPCNRHFIELFNGTPQPLRLSPDQGFPLTMEALQQAWQDNTVAALLASPDNPTGRLLSLELMAKVHQWTAMHGGTLIVDEIYQGLEYGGIKPTTVLQQTDDVIVLNSFSKYFGMTGFRLGWMVVPEYLVDPLTRMAQNFFLAPNTISQHAAMALFQESTMEELERRRQVLSQRREAALAALQKTGITIASEAQGAFYIYLDIRQFGLPAMDFCQRLLEEYGVALTPGDDFGAAHGPAHYVRMAYTTDVDRIEQAIHRIANFVQAL